MTFETPILFLVFNRPSTTSRVFERIREVRPKHLFVAADGPRAGRSDDVENCRTVRDIVSKVDWDCTVRALFRDENLGCGQAVSSAISWYFDQVESGIILEDDVLPDPTFFTFCADLLQHYWDDTRVMSISGTNFFPGKTPASSSYYFSRYIGIWGWATWRRAWEGYDVSLVGWKAPESRVRLRKEFLRPQTEFLEQIFEGMLDKRIDTWDYQWWFKVLMAGGLSITPSRNLTVNLGFDGGGTHTNNVIDEIRNLPLQSLESPLKHPAKAVVSTRADLALAKKYYWTPAKPILSTVTQFVRNAVRQVRGRRDDGTE